MADSRIEMLSDESFVDAYMGFNLTNKRLFLISKDYYECSFLSNIDSASVELKNYPWLIVAGVIFSLLWLGMDKSAGTIMLLVIGILMIVAYFKGKTQIMAFKSNNNEMTTKIDANNKEAAIKFINKVLKAKEETRISHGPDLAKPAPSE